MTKNKFMELMRFSEEWEKSGMYPDELFLDQFNGYEPGHEEGAEHDRNGAFHWWLKKDPSKEELIILTRLTFLDPDQHMAEDVRSYIIKARNFESETETLMKELYIERLVSVAAKRDS